MSLRPWTGTHVKKQRDEVKNQPLRSLSPWASARPCCPHPWAGPSRDVQGTGCCPLDKATIYSAWKTPELGHQTPGDQDFRVSTQTRSLQLNFRDPTLKDRRHRDEAPAMTQNDQKAHGQPILQLHTSPSSWALPQGELARLAPGHPFL